MSVSKHIEIPKQMIFWKWRDRGIYNVDRSPLTFTKDIPASPSTVPTHEDKSLFKHTDNKREITSSKIAEREMMRQVGMNPFIQSDYIQGIEIRDKYLVPYHESKPSYENDSNMSNAT